MGNKIVLVSDDTNFFEYIRTKLELRKSDEIFTFSFDSIPEKLQFVNSAVIIVNSENVREKTLDLLNLLKEVPVIIFAYNDDDAFKKKCFRAGAFDFMTLLSSDAEFRARMIPALSVSTLLLKMNNYRQILVKNNILSQNNEVYVDYNYILEKALYDIKEEQKKAVFGAISPNEKTKFLLKPAIIESIILNNIRKNDILMNYAPNKYFLILFDSDTKSANKIWDKICSQMSQKIYAGFSKIINQTRQQLINETLNKLHEAINNDRSSINETYSAEAINIFNNSNNSYSNFKLFRQEFGRKIEQIISPVFFQIQQKYDGKFNGIKLEHGCGEGYGTFYIKGKYSFSCLRITSPGFSKINIDITYQKNSDNIDTKRISLEPEELEAGLLEDLLEQFITDYTRSNESDA